MAETIHKATQLNNVKKAWEKDEREHVINGGLAQLMKTWSVLLRRIF